MPDIPAESLFSEALASLVGPGEALRILKNIGTGRIAELNGVLIRFFALVEGGDVYVDDTLKSANPDRPSLVPDALQPEDGLVLVRIREGATALALPVLGIALGCLKFAGGGGPTELLSPVLEGAKALWENVIRLRSPEDDDAIVTLRYMACVNARKGLVGRVHYAASTSELIEGTSMRPARTVAALRKLHELRVIDVSWEDQAGDFSKARNSWSIGL